MKDKELTIDITIELDEEEAIMVLDYIKALKKKRPLEDDCRS